MPSIGTVTRTGNGFKGQLKSVSFRADIEIVPTTRKSNDRQPDYRVFAAGVEVGAGWNRVGELIISRYRARQPPPCRRSPGATRSMR